MERPRHLRAERALCGPAVRLDLRDDPALAPRPIRHLVQQDGLPDAPEARHHDAPPREPLHRPGPQHREALELPVTTGELTGTQARSRGVGVPDRIHRKSIAL